MPDPCPLEPPYLSIGVLEIWYNEGGQQVRAIGTAWLFRMPGTDERRDLIIGAGHNFVHLGEECEEAHFTLYGDRDVNSIAVRRDGSRRFAVAGTQSTADLGVAVLAEPAQARRVPILLERVREGDPVPGVVAGALAREVEHGNRTIWMNRARIRTDVYDLLAFPRGTTEPGMSGGPVLIDVGGAARAIGVVHGAGSINHEDCDLATALSAANLHRVRDLVARSLS